jgi:hypothetical protein
MSIYGMQPLKAMVLDVKALAEITVRADFTYHITPDTISIIDTGKGRCRSHLNRRLSHFRVRFFQLNRGLNRLFSEKS